MYGCRVSTTSSKKDCNELKPNHDLLLLNFNAEDDNSMLVRRFTKDPGVTALLNGRVFKTFEALIGLKPLQPHLHQDLKRPYALAVSGGIDSIALSFLYVELLRLHKIDARALGSRAYVVDHGGEANSAAEARRTVDYLETRLKLPATVLTIDVPFGNHYETRARELRWRAIGQAALQNKQGTILTAHHFDDVIETFLGRLIRGHSGDSLLRPLPLTAFPIPKSGYGINEEFKRAANGDRKAPRPIAGRGIQVLRPLLQCSKAELNNLCVDHHLEWIEDETNKDVSLTERNSIRYLLAQSSRLPKALRPAEIGKRIDDMQARMDRIDELTDKFEEYLPKHTHDLRCASVTQIFPISRGREPDSRGKKDPLLTETDETISMVIARYLERLGQLVNSSDSSGVRAQGTTELVETIKKYMYDELGPQDDRPIREQKHSAKFIRWIVNKRSTSNRASNLFHEGLRVSCLSIGTHHTQPIVIPPGQTQAQRVQWDGLWWINIQNHTNIPLELRAFGKGAHETFSQLLTTQNVRFKALAWVFKQKGMVYARAGIPVLAIHRPEDEGLKLHDPKRLNSIVAFPTLGWIDSAWDEGLSMDVQYKHVREIRRRNAISIPSMNNRVWKNKDGWKYERGQREVNPKRE